MAAPIARASLGVDPKNRSCDRQSRMCRGSISCPMKSWLRRTYQVGCTSAGVSGRARVVDGDTLDVGAVRVRLHGVDAPESRQSCVAGGRRWACGERATRALAERIGGRDGCVRGARSRSVRSDRRSVPQCPAGRERVDGLPRLGARVPAKSIHAVPASSPDSLHVSALRGEVCACYNPMVQMQYLSQIDLMMATLFNPAFPPLWA